MRQNGIALPAANTTGRGPVFTRSKVNTTTAQFKAATTKCTPQRACDIVEMYGAERLLVNSAGDWGPSKPTAVPDLFIVPASVDLSGAEIELVEMERREFRLRDAVSGSVLDYDYVLIDCPPSLGLLTLNALVAADAVLVPLQCEFYALEGLSHLIRTIERVKRHLNPSLEIQGIVLTMFDKRNNLSDLVAADVRGHLGVKVYDTVIPRNVRVSEAPSHGKPVLLYDLRCPGAQAYVHLAGEVLRREHRLTA